MNENSLNDKNNAIININTFPISDFDLNNSCLYFLDTSNSKEFILYNSLNNKIWKRKRINFNTWYNWIEI